MNERREELLNVQGLASHGMHAEMFVVYEHGYLYFWSDRQNASSGGDPELTLSVVIDIFSVNQTKNGNAFVIHPSNSGNTIVLVTPSDESCQEWVTVLNDALYEGCEGSDFDDAESDCIRYWSQTSFEQCIDVHWILSLKTERFRTSVDLKEDERAGWVNDCLNSILQDNLAQECTKKLSVVECACNAAHKIMDNIQGLVTDYYTEVLEATSSLSLLGQAHKRSLLKFVFDWAVISQRLMLSRLLLELIPHMGLDQPQLSPDLPKFDDLARLLSVSARLDLVMRDVIRMAGSHCTDIRPHLKNVGALTADAIGAASQYIESEWKNSCVAICAGSLDKRDKIKGSTELAYPLVSILNQGTRITEISQEAQKSLCTNCVLVMLSLLQSATSSPPPITSCEPTIQDDRLLVFAAECMAASSETNTAVNSLAVDSNLVNELTKAWETCARRCAQIVSSRYFCREKEVVGGEFHSFGVMLFEPIWRERNVVKAMMEGIDRWRGRYPPNLPYTIRSEMDAVGSWALVSLYIGELLKAVLGKKKDAVDNMKWGEKGFDGPSLNKVKRDLDTIMMHMQKWRQDTLYTPSSKFEGAMHIFDLSIKFLQGRDNTCYPAFVNAVTAFNCIGGAASNGILCLYDHLRSFLKIRSCVDMAFDLRKEELAFASECIIYLGNHQSAELPTIPPSISPIYSSMSSLLESLYPLAGRYHSTGELWRHEKSSNESSARVLVKSAVDLAIESLFMISDNDASVSDGIIYEDMTMDDVDDLITGLDIQTLNDGTTLPEESQKDMNIEQISPDSLAFKALLFNDHDITLRKSTSTFKNSTTIAPKFTTFSRSQSEKIRLTVPPLHSDWGQKPNPSPSMSSIIRSFSFRSRNWDLPGLSQTPRGSQTSLNITPSRKGDMRNKSSTFNKRSLFWQTGSNGSTNTASIPEIEVENYVTKIHPDNSVKPVNLVNKPVIYKGHDPSPIHPKTRVKFFDTSHKCATTVESYLASSVKSINHASEPVTNGEHDMVNMPPTRVKYFDTTHVCATTRGKISKNRVAPKKGITPRASSFNGGCDRGRNFLSKSLAMPDISCQISSKNLVEQTVLDTLPPNRALKGLRRPRPETFSP